MKTTMLKRTMTTASLMLVLVAFQNCSPAFHSLDATDVTSLQESQTPEPIEPLPPAPVVILEKSLNASELQTITVDVNSPLPLTPTALPAGASFDATSSTFRWLPKTGQAGSYTLSFKTPVGQTLAILKLQVAALPAATVARGPIDGARDGDVGFIFIHGMGDVDRCADPANLAAYWEKTPNVIARGTSPKKVVCYDARASVESVAPSVAQQILAADCGRFNRCILVTHSMGGLVAEFMMTHARAAQPGDALPALFASADLYKQVKSRTLSVISLGSAAGGSKVADSLQSGAVSNSVIGFVANIASWIGANSDSTRSVTVARASAILAPIWEDPGVPVYMIPGYSARTAWEWDTWTGGLYGVVGVPNDVFQGDFSLTALDGLMKTNSRFDGLVDFRSACGIASLNPEDGPGYAATLPQQFEYCAKSTKKANHHVWFATTINHLWMPTDWSGCTSGHTCVIQDLDPVTKTFTANTALNGKSAVAAIRAKLDEKRTPSSEIATDLTVGVAGSVEKILSAR